MTTNTTAQMTELQFLEATYAGLYAGSGMSSYLDGYQDGERKWCNVERANEDSKQFDRDYADGLCKQAQDWQRRRELDLEVEWLEYYTEIERDECEAARYAWAI